MSESYILSILTFLPLAGAIAVLFFNNNNANSIRFWALGVSVVNFLASLPLLSGRL